MVTAFVDASLSSNATITGGTPAAFEPVDRS
jgi:hypothetical protein